MDVRMLQSLTFLLTLLPWSKDNGEVQPPLEGLKKQRNQKLQSVKNSRMYELSPHSVLSAISGSLSLPALTFVVFLLLIQTSEGDEVTSSVRPSFRFSITPAGDDVTSSDWPSVKTTTPPPPSVKSFVGNIFRMRPDAHHSFFLGIVVTTTPPPPPSEDDTFTFNGQYSETDTITEGERAFEKENEVMEEEAEETNKLSTTEDDTFTFNGQYSETDTITEADPGIPREVLYAVIGVLVLALILIIVCVCWRKNNTERAKESDSAEGLLPCCPKDVTQVSRTHSTKKQKLDSEDRTETAEVRNELQSQPEEVKREGEEGEKKLQEAQTETAQVRKELQSQLEEVKRKREENKKKLDECEKELKNNKEMTMDEKQKLKGEREHCLQQKQILKEIYTEKDKVLTQIDKLLQAVDTAAKSMSTHQTV